MAVLETRVAQMGVTVSRIFELLSSSSSMELQPGVDQSLLLLGFHPAEFLVGKCAFCSE